VCGRVHRVASFVTRTRRELGGRTGLVASSCTSVTPRGKSGCDVKSVTTALYIAFAVARVQAIYSKYVQDIIQLSG